MESWMNFILFLAVTGYAVYLIIKVIYHRYTYIKLGKPTILREDVKERMKTFFPQVFGQKKLLKDRKSGIMHVMMFYGFIILQFGALDIIYKGLVGKGLPIPGYAYFLLSQEITVISILIAVVYALYRRYGEKLKRLKRGWKASLVSFFIIFLMGSVLLTLGFERISSGDGPSGFSPVSSLVVYAFDGLSQGLAHSLYLFFWWSHLLVLLSFALYVPQSKHFHLFTAPINIWLRRTDSPGKLRSINLEDEEAESFGVGRIEDFEQKQLLDLYACVECGRCTNVCPASGTGKFLSPMHLMTKLRDHLTEKGASATSNSPWLPSYILPVTGVYSVQASKEQAGIEAAEMIIDIQPTLSRQKETWIITDREIHDINLIGDVITEEEIWSCTSCRNCEDQCPVGNEHVDKIIDLRRYLVLTEGKVPQDAQRAMQNIERQGNPWGISRNDREKWMEALVDMEVPMAADNPEFDMLLFIGTMGSYDNRSMKVTRALIGLLNEAGVKFAVLGNEEKNSGDTPRRLGNEFQFQELCRENIAIFQKYHVKKIVTACPHTFNTFKNEYPEFGLQAEVVHHTQLLAQLIKEGRIQPKYEVNERITYHDSCYLGRYNNVYDEPRDILRAIPGVELVEMERSRENSMCCGAGGGMMWMEEDTGKRVNVARTEQALEVQPDTISSACPYCLTMLSDGTKMKGMDQQIKTRDVAEILWESVHVITSHIK
ncbi:MAG: heterodisulfide reductase-related iron-sulfur binding cluster [Paenibacillaceae bacterium]